MKKRRKWKKKSPLRLIKEACHKAWSLAVRERDKRCVWCASKKKLQAHHIVAVSLSNAYGRYDLLNGMTLCFRCHIHRLKNEVDDYIAVRDSFLAEKGLIYQQLREWYRPIVKLKIDDYEYLLDKLKGGGE